MNLKYYLMVGLLILLLLCKCLIVLYMNNRNQENEDLSTSRFKHTPGISPKLVDMIRFVIPKKYKGVKYLPICPK